MSEVKLCVNCKHYKHEEDGYMDFKDGYVFPHTCLRDHTATISLVTGEPNGKILDCNYEREHDSTLEKPCCGEDGQFFETKE